ncbi:MAG: hypothetical protein J0M08_10835 [Bacteroidetes bacterium]|nr:hypothetical protein [Bacteroidota bacterium]
MKKHILFWVLALTFSAINAQSNKLGTVSGNIGANAGINAAQLGKAGISSYTLSDASIFTSNFPIELNLGIAKPLSIGANYTPSNWSIIGESGNVSGKFAALGANINLYIINRNRFNMQLSLTPSYLLFKPIDFSFNQNSNTIKANLSGVDYKARLLFNIYFTNHFGMYFNIGYNTYKISISDYNLLLQDPNLEQELKDLISENFKSSLPGFQGGAGIVFKFK